MAIDAFVGILAVFFQPLMGPLLDIPVKDPAVTTIAGGEFIVVGLIYLITLRDPQHYRVLLYVVALDQAFAALLAAVEIQRGEVAATWKTLAPIPLSAILAGIYFFSARGLGRASRT